MAATTTTANDHLSEFYSLVTNGPLAHTIQSSSIDKNHDNKPPSSPFTQSVMEASSKQPSNITPPQSELFRNKSIDSFNTIESSSVAGNTGSLSINGSTMFHPENLPALITTQEISDTLSCYSDVLQAAKHYREAINQAAVAAAQFGEALEECSKCKGAGKSSDGLLAAGGLQYMVSNHEQILARSIETSFEEPVKEQLDVLKSTAEKNENQFKNQLKQQTRQLRAQEKSIEKLAQKKIRNLSEYRLSLQDLTSQIDEIDHLKYNYFQSAYDLVQNTSTKILGHASSVVRAQVEINEGIARKGWSGGGLDDLISTCPDPFADQQEQEEDYDKIGTITTEEMNYNSDTSDDDTNTYSVASNNNNGLFEINGEFSKNRTEKIYSVLPNNRSILPSIFPKGEDNDDDDSCGGQSALPRTESYSTITRENSSTNDDTS